MFSHTETTASVLLRGWLLVRLADSTGIISVASFADIYSVKSYRIKRLPLELKSAACVWLVRHMTCYRVRIPACTY